MPFTLVRGTYHLVNRNTAGRLLGFEPDGDSIHFKPENPDLLRALPQPGRPLNFSGIGSVQLRFEGVDALELHFTPDGGHETRQPRPLADAARDFLTGQLGLNPVPYLPPRNLSVAPPVARDAVPGYILTRTLEVNGRPVAFAFGGAAPAADGATVALGVAQLPQSLNYQLLRAGQAYPLFYETLFADLRRAMARAARLARQHGRGLWPRDVSTTGLTAISVADLESSGVVFPKLFRRLAEFWALQPGAALDQFPAWLAGHGEQVLDLSTINFTHFDNVIVVENGRVRLTQAPETLVFISAK